MTEPATATESRATWVRSLALSAALLIALLGLAEVALRTSYVFGALPAPMPYYTFDVTRRLHYYDALLRERGPVDVLFVGSSAVRAGIRPPVFDEAVRKAGGGEVLSFNGGFSKMFPASARLYLDHVWLARDKPRFVLHGIRPIELSSYPERAPKHLRFGLIESLWFKNDWLSMRQAELIGHSKLLQYRGVLNTTLTRWSEHQPLHAIPERDELLSDNTGFRAEKHHLSAILADEEARVKNVNLWLYDAAVKRSQLERGLSVLNAMRRSCERAGVQYVLVILPEHPNRFSPKRGPATWQLYQKMVKAWAQAHHVPLIDITRGDYRRFSDIEYYADYHHLRPEGATALSELVARDFAALLKTGGEVRSHR